MTLKPIALVVAAGVMASGLVVGTLNPAQGKGKGGGGGNATETRIEARLVPSVNTPIAGAEGEAERRTRAGDDEFKVTVEFPLGSTLTDVTAHLSRANSPYADCTLVRDLDETLVIEFKVDIRNRGVLQSKKGSCVATGTTTPNILPDAQAGDTVSITVNGNAGALTGTFVNH